MSTDPVSKCGLIIDYTVGFMCLSLLFTRYITILAHPKTSQSCESMQYPAVEGSVGGGAAPSMLNRLSVTTRRRRPGGQAREQALQVRQVVVAVDVHGGARAPRQARAVDDGRMVQLVREDHRARVCVVPPVFRQELQS